MSKKNIKKEILADCVLLSYSIGTIVVPCGVAGVLIGACLDMTNLAWLSIYFLIAGLILIAISTLIAVSGCAEKP